MSLIANYDFITTAITSIAATDTATDGSEFTSNVIPVDADMGTITVVFTGSSGMDGSDVDFYFYASHDGGTSYSTLAEFLKVSTPTVNTSPYLVRYSEINWFQGISHLKLWKITNGDTGKAITSVNASFSRGYARPQISFRH